MTPDEKLRYEQHLDATIDREELVAPTQVLVRELINALGPLGGMIVTSQISQMATALGAPNSPLRAAWMAYLTKCDLLWSAAQDSFQSAETYRESMLKD